MNRSSTRPPIASRFVAHPEVDVAHRDRTRFASQEVRHERGVGLPEHERRTRLHDPRLLGRDVLERGPDVLDVVHAHVGDHGDRGLDHVGGVAGAAQTHLHDGGVDRDVVEPAERGGGEDLEVARGVGNLFVDTHDRGFRKRFAAAAERREAELRTSLRNAGVDALELSTEDDLVDAILRFSDLRKRRSQLAAGATLPQHLVAGA